MKKRVLIFTFLTIVILVILISLLVWKGSLKNAPKETTEQQELISRISRLYEQKKSEGMEFSSQCLGVIGDYAVDIVHVPRSEEDNNLENQCEEYRKGLITKFVELDKNGRIVRIVD